MLLARQKDVPRVLLTDAPAPGLAGEGMTLGALEYVGWRGG